jgi:DNA-binding MarR family transcriptional regulator
MARPSKEISREPVDRVLSASRALVGIAARSLASLEGDITLAQYRALLLLCEHGQLNAGSLADLLAVTPPTATGLCDRLASKGLLTRQTSAESRREVILRPTGEGRAVVRAVTARRRRDLARVMSQLAPEDTQAVAAAFEKFAAAAGEIPDDAWRLGWI